MGGSHSRQPSGPGILPSDALIQTPDFFEIGFDELAAAEHFTSDIFTADPSSVVTPLSLPDQESVADIICDPLVFTSEETSLAA
jgi:hypothetical protein